MQGCENDVPGCLDVLDLAYNQRHGTMHDACCDEHKDVLFEVKADPNREKGPVSCMR